MLITIEMNGIGLLKVTWLMTNIAAIAINFYYCLKNSYRAIFKFSLKLIIQEDFCDESILTENYLYGSNASRKTKKI